MSESPEDRATKALQNAQDRLADAKDASNALEAGQIEDDAVQTVVDGVADALVSGLNKPVGFYAGIIADDCEYYSKTDIKQSIKERTEELAAEGNDKQRMDEFVQKSLDKVIVHRNSDAKQGAKFTWDFGSFQVQTESGSEGRGHYNWHNFREYIHESGGPNLAKPEKDRRSGDDWRDLMIQLIEDRGETRRITGKRTQAVKQLQKQIRQQTGYGTPTGALEYSGIWVIASRPKNAIQPPDWWMAFGEPLSDGRDLSKSTVREIRVHDTLIDKTTDDAGITRDALYQELDARSHTVPGSGGPSTLEYVDGTEERFWTLLPSIGTPRIYIPDPHAEPTSGSLLDTLSDGTEPDTSEPETDETTGFDSVGETA